MAKKKIGIGKVIRNIVLSFIVLCMMWVIFHTGMKLYEENKYPATGEYIDLEGEKLHVTTKGEGEKTIVLLPGLGTTAPALDFEPLMNELAKNFQVVVVEPFGYGWSDLTKRERTVENIVEEVRTALQTAQIEGPYILMPHSLAGIYSMYYANKYPEEIEAVVGIDPTLPQALEYFNEAAPKMPSYFSFIAPTGLARLALLVNAENSLPLAEEGTYSDGNLAMTKAISAWKGYNKNIVEEANKIEENAEKTKDLSFPAQLPVMIFMKEDDKVTDDGKSMESFYEQQLNAVNNQRLVTLKGHHYLHWKNYKKMTEEIKSFVDSF